MITPSDSPSSPTDYASVAESGVNIQAPQADLAAMTAGAKALTGTRQAETYTLLSSAQGTGEHDITAGFAADWPNSPDPDTP